MRPTVKSEWCRSGKVEVEDIPNLNIRQTQMHGNNSSGRYAVSSTSAFTSVSAIFPGNAPMPPSQGQASIPGPCIAPRLSHVGSRTAPAFGYRTWWVFIFAKRYEVQIGCANNGFNIRNSMSSRLQLACKCSHRIQVPGQRQIQKGNFHSCSIIHFVNHLLSHKAFLYTQ
jgi:hypothetical protein